MALLDTIRRDAIQETVNHWRDRCLIEDGSLLFPGGEVWTTGNLATLYRNLVKAPLLDHRSFLDKYREQLQQDRDLILLGAEVVTVYYLFVYTGGVTAATKRRRVDEILSWAEEQLSEGTTVWQAFGQGIGHPGRHYLSRPDLQLGFIIDFARRLKEQPADRRRELLADPWVLSDFMDATDDEATLAMRHVLLHLLHPDFFERIASGTHKQLIATTYADFAGDAASDLDERLLAIRERLEALLGRPRSQVDFYAPPLGGPGE